MKTCPGSATLPSCDAALSTPPELHVAVPNLSHAFCYVENSSHRVHTALIDQPSGGASSKMPSLAIKLSSIWPLPKKLAREVRYQLGSYPCRYNDLAKAGGNVRAAVVRCHPALAALELNGCIGKSDEKAISQLLDAITYFDKQCELWSTIIVNARGNEMLRSRVGAYEGGANPFEDVQKQLDVSRKQLIGSQHR